MKNQNIAYKFTDAKFNIADDRKRFPCFGNDPDAIYIWKIYIYGHGNSRPVARKIRDRHGNIQFVLFNDSSYSNTTSSDQSTVKAAFFQEIIKVSDLYASPKNLAQDLTNRMMDAALLLSNAKKEPRKKEYLKEIKIIFSHLLIIVDFYRIKSKLPKMIRDIYNLHGVDELIPFVTKRAIKEKKKQILIQKQKEQVCLAELANIQIFWV